MRRIALLALVLAAAVPAAAKSPAFPKGIWIGHGTVAARTMTVGKVKVHIAGGTVFFKLYVGAKVDGSLDVHVPHATGEISVGGTNATGEFKIFGDFDLAGTPSDVKVTGKYTMKGAVVVSGVDVPVNISFPADAASLQILTSTCTKVTGKLGPRISWTATRQPGSKSTC